RCCARRPPWKIERSRPSARMAHRPRLLDPRPRPSPPVPYAAGAWAVGRAHEAAGRAERRRVAARGRSRPRPLRGRVAAAPCRYGDGDLTAMATMLQSAEPAPALLDH